MERIDFQRIMLWIRLCRSAAYHSFWYVLPFCFWRPRTDCSLHFFPAFFLSDPPLVIFSFYLLCAPLTWCLFLFQLPPTPFSLSHKRHLAVQREVSRLGLQRSAWAVWAAHGPDQKVLHTPGFAERIVVMCYTSSERSEKKKTLPLSYRSLTSMLNSPLMRFCLICIDPIICTLCGRRSPCLCVCVGVCTSVCAAPSCWGHSGAPVY